MTTCTIQRAVDGKCGQPAVVTFKNSRGELFHECVDHAAHGAHVLTCDKPLPLCTICGGEFGLVPAPAGLSIWLAEEAGLVR